MRIVGATMTLILSLAIATAGTSAQALPEYTRTVDVGGYRTRVLEIGLGDREAGEPVVVLFAGSLVPLSGWGEWLSEVSESAPVVSYDRPGIGGSEYDGQEASPAHIVERAHAVLTTLDVPPPYVLVGHSWGAPLALYYAGAYPDEVVGLVYLDPLDARETICETLLIPDEQECAAEAAKRRRERGSLANVPPGQRAELEAIRRFGDASVDGRELPADPDVPTGVLLGTLNPRVWAGADEEFAAYAERWLAQRVTRYGDWVRGLRQGTLIVATDAGHFVYRDVPKLATAVVRKVLEAARAR